MKPQLGGLPRCRPSEEEALGRGAEVSWGYWGPERSVSYQAVWDEKECCVGG